MISISKAESQKFEGENTLYHYTSVYTALEHIFPSNQLRLSPVSTASDPMESIGPKLSISLHDYEANHVRLNKKFDGIKIKKKIESYYESLRQLCFCRNSLINPNIQHSGVFEPIDHFGFAKPRMWDQYGDKFKGVCIAISRHKLTEILTPDFKLMDVEYYSSKLFRPNIDRSRVLLNEVEKMGEEEFLKMKCASEIKKLCTKHLDYSDENETKLIKATNDEHAYIDLAKCIQAIFFTNRLNYTYESFLIETAKKYQIPIIQISINRTGFDALVFG